jgi:CRP-like cAMP-binding protein
VVSEVSAGESAVPGVPALAAWGEDAWARLLVHAEQRRFAAGQLVCPAGEVDRTLYIILDGSVEVRIPDVERRVTVERGAILGEMAFFDGEPRSASVYADGDVELLRLTPAAFEEFAEREPALSRAFILELGRIVSLRLRAERRAQQYSAAAPPRVAASAPLPSPRIEVDEALRERQLAEIADTDFFKGLLGRAQALRRRRGS